VQRGKVECGIVARGSVTLRQARWSKVKSLGGKSFYAVTCSSVARSGVKCCSVMSSRVARSIVKRSKAM